MLTKAGNKIFGNISVKSANLISPVIGYGRLDDAISMNTFYAYVLPFWTNEAKTITTVRYEVTTAATQTNTPTLQIAAYQSRPDYVQPTTQISNTYISGISTASTGVKSASFSSSWILPVGLTLLVVKTYVASGSNSDFGIRSFNQQSQVFFGQFGGGFLSPAAQFNTAGWIQLGIGNTTNLSTDLSSLNDDRGGNSNSALGFLLGQ